MNENTPKWGRPTESQEQPEMLPDSIAELEEMRLTLMEEIAGIQAQFPVRKAQMDERAAASGRFDRYGKPMNDPAEYAEYMRWRGSAAGACRWKQIELSNVKSAIKDIRARRGLVGKNDAPAEWSDDPPQALAVLLAVARRLAGRIGWDKLDDRDKTIIDLAKDLLKRRA